MSATGCSTGVTVVRGDIRDQALLERVLGEYEINTVFHLAAQTIVGIANRNPVSTFESNIAGHLGAARSVPAQSAGPAGRHRLVRQGLRRPGGSRTTRTLRCGAATPTMQQVVRRSDRADVRDDLGLPVAITRCGNFYGGGDLNWNRIVPGHDPLGPPGPAAVIRSDGNYVRDYFYVEDGAAAYCCWPRSWRPTLRSGRRPTISRTRSRSRSRTRRPHPRADGQFGPSGCARRSDARDPASVPERRPARRELGWAPLFTLDQGLERTIEWYRSFLAADERQAAGQARG